MDDKNRNDRNRNIKRKNLRRKKKKQYLFGAVLMFVAILLLMLVIIIEKRTPSKKHISETDFYKLYNLDINSEDKEMTSAIILQNKLIENETALIDSDRVYLKYEFLKTYVDDKYYWDNNENILLYTTPTDVISANVGSNEYMVTNTKNTLDYQIVKVNGPNVYIAMDFVKLYSNVQYNFYKNPNRVVLRSEWNVDVKTATLKKDEKIRTDKNIKSDIIYGATKNVKVYILEESSKWLKVITEDGIFGYVNKKDISSKKTETLKNDFNEPVYTNISKDKTLSIGWHMITGSDKNATLIANVTDAKGINVVCPTWYRFSDNDGNMESLVDASYVSTAHLVNLDVWAMVDDQSDASKDSEIFTYTSKRANIINTLVSDAIQYNIDGINLDVEYLDAQTSDAYIEFIRELSVKCRVNGIVLSVDVRVPEASNAFYNIKAIGEVVDYVIMMGYDEHWGVNAGAGSNASLTWVKTGIEKMVTDIDPQKVVLGIPFYTRSFTVDKEGNAIDSSVLQMGQDINELTSRGVEYTWVEDLGQNYGEYEDGENTVMIWIEDAASIEAKLKLIGSYNLAGMAAWRLGIEDSNIWNTIIKYTN